MRPAAGGDMTNANKSNLFISLISKAKPGEPLRHLRNLHLNHFLAILLLSTIDPNYIRNFWYFIIVACQVSV
jgi:hypothetical protein